MKRPTIRSHNQNFRVVPFPTLAPRRENFALSVRKLVLTLAATMAPRGKRKRWLLPAAGMLFSGALLALALQWHRLPSYEGKRIGFWWREYLDCQIIPFAGTSVPTPEFWEQRRRREEKALEAFKAMNAAAGPFLAAKFGREPLVLAYFRLRQKLSATLPKGMLDALPLPRVSGEKQMTAHRLLLMLPEARNRAKPQLFELLLEGHPEVRGPVACLLLESQLDCSDSVEQVTACLQIPTLSLSEWAARVLGEIGRPAHGSAADLRAARRHGYISASSCVRSLLAIGASPWSCLPALNHELSATNPAPTVALALVRSLGEHTREVLPGLSSAFQHPDPRFAALAIQTVAWLGSNARPLAPALIAALDSPWYFIRAESILALESIGGPEFAAALPQIRALESDPHPDVSSAARRALGSIEALLGAPF